MGLLSRGYVLPRRICRPAGIALWVRRSLLVLWRMVRPSALLPGPRGLPSRSSPHRAKRCDVPPTEFRPPQSVTGLRRPRLLTWHARAAPLMRFSAPPAQSTRRVHMIPGLPHPVRSALRVSHPLDGLLLDELPGLVSCRSAHGVPPFRAFPSLGALTPLDARCLPAVDRDVRIDGFLGT
jgi:hypothetical protein